MPGVGFLRSGSKPPGTESSENPMVADPLGDPLSDPLSDPLAGGSLSDVAAAGTSGPGGPLPFKGSIQASFGRHDLSRVRAHSDASAQKATARLGTTAFAAGDDVVLGAGADLHTVAHEAAHVVQQRSGVQLHGGLQGPGDPDERHANAVADLVVAGRSAEGLLDERAGAGSAMPVQGYTTQGTHKLTEHASMYCVSTTTDQLFVHPNAAPPQPAGKFQAGQSFQIGQVQYVEYTYTGAWLNDCLELAEIIIQDLPGRSDRPELRAQGDRPNGTDRLFGHTDAQNRSIAGGTFAQDAAADPGVGQAYATGRTVQPLNGQCPYHIAAVIAMEGGDRVTAEADASDPNRNSPVFDIYDTTPVGQRTQGSLSFHEVYVNPYTTGHSPPGTGVLYPR